MAVEKCTDGDLRFEWDADGDHAIYAGDTLIAVTVGVGSLSREEDEANARLLTSAKRRLEALHEVYAQLKIADAQDAYDKPLERALQEAIRLAKAGLELT
jgi:hypothetical protein